MKTFVKSISIDTKNRRELVNITSFVEQAVKESGINNGIVLVFVPHATATIVVNEDEQGLKKDIINWIDEFLDKERKYYHNLIDNNADSHIAASFFGPSKVFPLVNGKLIRGTWQEIMLFELDGPRNRRQVLIEVLGE
ncbi:MAG: secondary thiamine-phosphate synthase enzyme YjbQ [Fervidicoccus fontis]